MCVGTITVRPYISVNVRVDGSSVVTGVVVVGVSVTVSVTVCVVVEVVAVVLVCVAVVVLVLVTVTVLWQPAIPATIEVTSIRGMSTPRNFFMYPESASF
jgi:hypothetical protein